ncbi:MAG: hypothetical protein LBG89_02745 [Rickettsiales bacterium]|jgi:hypothetical protein|nr:hypothetical protein [Rickettsiales bacterium]
MLKNLIYKSKKIYSKVVWATLNLAFFVMFAWAVSQFLIEMASGRIAIDMGTMMIWGFLIVQWAALRFAKNQGAGRSGNSGGNNFNNNRPRPPFRR